MARPDLAHADAPALDLAGVALGTGRASRLYRAVRDRQLASSASAWHYTAGDVGVFVVHAEGPAEHAPAAAQQMWREVQSARRDGFRAGEVARAQRILEARWLRRLETMDGQATYLASWEADGGLDRAATYYDRLLSLSPGALQAAAHTHLDPDHASVVSYRPVGGEPLAALDDDLRERLRDVERSPSSVVPPPDVPTPPGTPAINDAIGDATVHAAPANSRVVVAGTHVQTLATGVTVLIQPRPGSPLVNIGVFQRGGSAVEAPGREGLARLTAHAMLKGTATRSGARIAELAEELGASIGVSASLESVGWSMSVPVRHLRAATSLLADVTQYPAFPDDGVDTERALAIAEVTRLRDDMYRWPTRLATAAAYGEHPYARTVVGTTESLEGIDTAAVRAFHADHILRAATVIAVVGDVDPDATIAMVAREFPTLAYREDVALPAAEWPRESLRVDDQRDKQQTAMTLLFPGPARVDPDRFAARVLSSVASGLGGRFFEQLRDRQSLAYTVSAFPVERRASGLFVAYIATSPSREDEARTGLLREFAKLRERPPSAEELDRARRYLVGTHAIGQQSGSTVLGDLVDSWLFGSGLEERHAFTARVEAVTIDDLHRLVLRYFSEERVVEGVVRGTA